MAYEYEWDTTKRRTNLNKHGIDFEVIYSFDWKTAYIIFNNSHTEPRWIAYGMINERLHAVVFTRRRDKIRIISLRKANIREEKMYAQNH